MDTVKDIKVEEESIQNDSGFFQIIVVVFSLRIDMLYSILVNRRFKNIAIC